MRKWLAFIAIINFILSTHLAFASDKTVAQLNNFSFKLFRQTVTSEQNSIFSPYSVSSVMILLTFGAEGNTQQQLLNLFDMNSAKDLSQLNQVLLNIDNYLEKSNCHNWFSCQFYRFFNFRNDADKFISSNAFWADKQLEYKQRFLSLLKENPIYFSTLDFKNQSDESREIINNWVDKKTNHNIKNLLSPGTITPDTLFVITNAIYFKGKWKLPFKITDTSQQPFFQTPTQQLLVPMMMQTDKFNYVENDILQMLIIEYQNKNLAMAVLLPKQKHPLAAIKQYLNDTNFQDLYQAASLQEVSLNLPKFTIESNFSLSAPLSKMGLSELFTTQANFKGITESALYITNIIQKARIKVDEEGTVAAAATAVIMMGTAYHPPKEFNANHPFIFLIFDTTTKIVLFIGQVAQP